MLEDKPDFQKASDDLAKEKEAIPLHEAKNL
jgi:hypothetical protein